VSVYIADGKPLFGDAARAQFGARADLNVMGVATDGMHAIAEISRLRPSVAVIDVDLPNCDGVRATRLIRDRTPTSVVLVADGEDDALLLDAVHAGATGFVSRESPIEALIEATRAVARGDVAIPPRMLAGLIAGLVRRRREQEVAMRVTGTLTPREREILLLVAGGADNDAIAQRLVISPQTVRTHTQNLLRKLGLHSRLEAAAFVLRNRIGEELEVINVGSLDDEAGLRLVAR
jgi:two-component system, NarL family, nitrate/nitrite response regulator NarL